MSEPSLRDIMETVLAKAAGPSSSPRPDMGPLADATVTAVVDFISKQGFLRYAGPFSAATAYTPGALVQRSGALWVCEVATSETPGSSDHWRRLAKSQ